MRKEIIFELIKKIPGISYNEIVHKTALSNGVISHYLIKLLDDKEIEKEGIIRGKYFEKNIPEKERILITILRNKTNNEIFKLLMKDSKKNIFTANEISKKIKKSSSTISVSLKSLQKNKIVERVLMNKNTILTNDLGYKIHNKKKWIRFFEKYNL